MWPHVNRRRRQRRVDDLIRDAQSDLRDEVLRAHLPCGAPELAGHWWVCPVHRCPLVYAGP